MCNDAADREGGKGSAPENWEHSGHFPYCSDLVPDDLLPGCGRGSCIVKHNSAVSDALSAHKLLCNSASYQLLWLCCPLATFELNTNICTLGNGYQIVSLRKKRTCCKFPGVEPCEITEQGPPLEGCLSPLASEFRFSSEIEDGELVFSILHLQVGNLLGSQRSSLNLKDQSSCSPHIFWKNICVVYCS